MGTGKLDLALIYGVLRGGAYEEFGLNGFGGVKGVILNAPTAATLLTAQQVLTISTSITAAS